MTDLDLPLIDKNKELSRQIKEQHKTIDSKELINFEKEYMERK